MNDLFPSQLDDEQEDLIATELETQHVEPNTDCTEEQTEDQGRYPKRTRKVPERLGDYYVDNDNELYDYCYFVNVPTSYNEAVNCENAAKWQKAMDEEIETLEHNDTFSLSELPKDKTAVGGKWVFAIKGNEESPIYKARYVARGFSQIEGIDFTETCLYCFYSSVMATLTF